MNQTRALITLTNEESKRLIAKGIAHLPVIKKAKETGIIGFCVCSSARYVAEEILTRKMPQMVPYVCGYLNREGLSALPESETSDQLVLINGEETWLDWPKENLSKYIKKMDSKDIIIKSGNILDKNNRAAKLVGLSNGGEYGKYLPYILSRGITLIVPMTINKSIPFDLEEVIPEMGITKFPANRTHGEACGLLPLPGIVFTEVDAFRILTDCRALPVAVGGVADGQGCVSLVLIGDEANIDKAWHLVESIKGEPSLSLT